MKDWKPMQIMVLLDDLLNSKKIDAAKCAKLDEAFEFSKFTNSEVRFRWQKLCIQAEYDKILPDTLKFVTEQGRMKFTRPLYRALFKSKMGKEAAITTFSKHKGTYHPICAKMVT